ncbi:M23 family metallopeptidase [Arthrobacter crusticola]|nr:M23 family metallopeptidase [Arthrobacter crusticola]
MTNPALPGRRRASAAVPSATSATPAPAARPALDAVPAFPSRRSLRPEALPVGRSEPLPVRRRDLRHTAAVDTKPAGLLPRVRAGALVVGLAAVGAGLVMGAVPAPASMDTKTATAQAAPAVSLPPVTADAAADLDFSRQKVAGVAMAKSGGKAKTLSTGITRTGDKPTLAAPLENLTVASTFGYRVNPLGGYAPELHTGIDYAGACGTPVNASDGGVVVDAGWHAYGGGQRIVIDHGDGLKSTYNHLSSIGVSTGQTIARGAQIGAVGTTGNSTGCHLHFEVLVNDEKVDPLPWL